MAMTFLGVQNVPIGKAIYALPDYAIVNPNGYTFDTMNFRPVLFQQMRVTGGAVTSFAYVAIGPTGYNEIVLNPNVGAGSVYNGVGSTRDQCFDTWGTQGSDVTQHTQFCAQFNGLSLTYSPMQVVFSELVGVPPATVQMTVQGLFGFSHGTFLDAHQSPGTIWVGSFLNDSNGFYASAMSESGPASYCVFKDPSMNVVQVDVPKAVHSYGGMANVFVPKNTAHPALLYRNCILQPFVSNGCQAVSPYLPEFGNVLLDTLLQNNSFRVSVWWGGFMFSMNAGGAGPTGQYCEIVITDPNMTTYKILRFIPQDDETKQALLSSSGTWDAKIDVDGIVYFSPTTAPFRRSVYTSFGFAVDAPSIQFANLPPFSLPCFNPCLPSDLSRANM